jgi:hypothetical protein
MHVQGWRAEEVPHEAESYESVHCGACGVSHLVDPVTGKVINPKRNDPRR